MIVAPRIAYLRLAYSEVGNIFNGVTLLIVEVTFWIYIHDIHYTGQV